MGMRIRRRWWLWETWLWCRSDGSTFSHNSIARDLNFDASSRFLVWPHDFSREKEQFCRNKERKGIKIPLAKKLSTVKSEICFDAVWEKPGKIWTIRKADEMDSKMQDAFPPSRLNSSSVSTISSLGLRWTQLRICNVIFTLAQAQASSFYTSFLPESNVFVVLVCIFSIFRPY